ncbi:hypothetical protein ACHAPT_007409 [Fusarium lateritium]
MSRNLLPFLYQTRTLQFACRRPVSLLIAQKAGIVTNNKRTKRVDNSIPFEWDDEEQAASHDTLEQEGTLTPTETEIFKSIFDEIAQGRLPKAKKRPESAEEQATQTAQKPADKSSGEERLGGSLVDQARDANLSEEFLKRYPTSLRQAAQTALGKFEFAPKRPKFYDTKDLDEAEAKQMAEWARYEKIRQEEKLRVEKLMVDCVTDAELWKVMEKEVFLLPKRLGIADPVTPRKRTTAKKESKANEVPPSQKLVMDVHGPLYPHYLSTGLKLFDSAFAQPSSYAFKILPRIKEIGLSSYVLGVSTPLFTRLADIYWRRYGDATAALDALDEMQSVGLYPDEEVEKVVKEISQHLHSCTWGAQGPFVMAMMESPPYDASLTARLERLEQVIAGSQNE